MIEYRTHYLVYGFQPRCGNPHYQNWTIDPTKVTCKSCKKLMEKELQS